MLGEYFVNKHPHYKNEEGLCVLNPQEKNWNKFRARRELYAFHNREKVMDWKRVMQIVRSARKEVNLVSIEITESKDEFNPGYRIIIKRKIQQNIWES